MSNPRDNSIPLVDSVFLPTDFSEGARVAFYHALKTALVAKSRLTLFHVSPETESEWTDFPGVRETLERWGLLPKDSPRSAVPHLGIDVRKVIAQQNDPVEAVLHYLEEHPSDLIVLATHEFEGRAQWLVKSVAEPVARRAAQMSLFIPDGSEGFVSAEDGSVTLENILIPVSSAPSPRPALEAAALLVNRLKCPQGVFSLLHVGDEGALEALDCPEVPGWEWRKITLSGDVIGGIVETASKTDADLIIMTTDGRHGFLDALRGSHSERVLRHGVAPLLALPEGSLASGSLF